jgi:hypothetical protein
VRSVERWEQRESVVDEFVAIGDEHAGARCECGALAGQAVVVTIRNLEDREAPETPVLVTLLGGLGQALIQHRVDTHSHDEEAGDDGLVTKYERLVHAATVSNTWLWSRVQLEEVDGERRTNRGRPVNVCAIGKPAMAEHPMEVFDETHVGLGDEHTITASLRSHDAVWRSATDVVLVKPITRQRQDEPLGSVAAEGVLLSVELLWHGKFDGSVPVEWMRVVIDANVFVSAAIGRGPSTRLIDQWLSGRALFESSMCPMLVGDQDCVGRG